MLYNRVTEISFKCHGNGIGHDAAVRRFFCVKKHSSFSNIFQKNKILSIIYLQAVKKTNNLKKNKNSFLKTLPLVHYKYREMNKETKNR